MTPTRPAVGPRKILQITSYPPPRAGWGVRVQFLKERLEAEGHRCVVLNTGVSRRIPSTEYETVLGGFDFARKVWRYSRQGFVAHVHVNGASPKGFALALAGSLINLLAGRRAFLTFHAGVDQPYFPRSNCPWMLPLFWLLFLIPRRIICNNEAVKAKIQEYGVPAGKITPIPAFSRQYVDFTPVPLPPAIEQFSGRNEQTLFTYVRVRRGFYLDVLVDGLARLTARRPGVGLVMCGVSAHQEPGLWPEVTERIARLGLDDKLCIVADLDHDEFLTALGRSAAYVRTPTSDGVASSVLEALALGVPVVAAENGSRPPGVITYRATDPDHLAAVLEEVLADRDRIARSLPRPEDRDTVGDEVCALTIDD